VTGPLDGIRVLDISTFLAGPYAATLLGDLGADVIKIEPPAGDESRHLGPERGGERAPFVAVNRNKRGVVLDLESDAGQQAAARLIATADVLITNVREPALSRLGLSYEGARAHREDIIWAGVTAFGPEGPYAGRPGIDFLAQGYAGLIALNGEPDGRKLRVTVPLVDVMTSLLVAAGVLAALHERAASGKGQRIDVSLLDALVHAQSTGLASLFLAGEVSPRTGNRSRYFAPSGVYPCADGELICITCPTEKFFRNLAQALGADWPSDARFKTIPLRMEHQDELDAEIAARCAEMTRDELLERLIAADVLAAPVHELPDVVRDPQVLHNEMVVTTEHATLGPLDVTGVPIKLARTRGSVRRSPPVLGQHTAEVLAELGYTAEQIEEIASKVRSRR
jgi:crotonobetainyl-CoA:carnitine CoA-transferase CaiB-like acyl-CoA transferase